MRGKLDRKVLDAVLDASDGEERVTLLAELVAMYVEFTPRVLAALRQALATGDHETLEKQAHRLRGSSANLGASEVAALAEALEEAVIAGEVPRDATCLAELEAAYEAARTALEELVRAES